MFCPGNSTLGLSQLPGVAGVENSAFLVLPEPKAQRGLRTGSRGGPQAGL